MKKAYTLSEVLVVLLVLGIIAAFIIPAVMRTAPDRAAILYKKTFYSLQEASQKIINDETLYPQNHLPDDDPEKRYGYFSDKPYLSGFGATEQSKYLCYNLAKTLNTVGEVKCDSAGSESEPNFTTTNGVRWWNVAGNTFGGGGGPKSDEYYDITVQCNGTNFNIRIFADGRIGTGPENNTNLRVGSNNADNNDTIQGNPYQKENEILRAPFKFRDIH